MRKKYILFLICITITIFIITYRLVSKRNNSFDYIETAVIYMYKEDNKNTLKYLNKAHMARDKDIYEIINLLADEEILNEFYKNKEGTSYGYAELRKATHLIYSNRIEEGILKLKSSIDQGNVRAMSFLGNYLYTLKRYKEAYQYLEMAYDNKDYKVYEKYIELKNNLEEYQNIEKLYFKYNKNIITDEERMKLGKFFIDKDEFELAYKVLRTFLESDDFFARLSKAIYLDREIDDIDSLKEYNKLFLENQYPKLLSLIISKLNTNFKKNRLKILNLLEDLKYSNKDIDFLKANILYQEDRWVEAENIYLDLAENFYHRVYPNLAKHYENKGEFEKAINIYKKSFLVGDQNAILSIYNIIKDNKDKDFIITNEELDEYLKISSFLGSNESMYILATSTKDLKLKKKYSLISFSMGNLKALELLIEIANIEKDKEKIKVYTNVLINNR